jgi:hypothetical protein
MTLIEAIRTLRKERNVLDGYIRERALATAAMASVCVRQW